MQLWGWSPGDTYSAGSVLGRVDGGVHRGMGLARSARLPKQSGAWEGWEVGPAPLKTGGYDPFGVAG